jgi:hypothetical protein
VLGTDDNGESSPPSGTYTQLDARGLHTCALSSAGEIACWGQNAYGEANVPAAAAGLRYVQAAAGAVNSCGLQSDGAVVCWGNTITGVNSAPPGSYTQVAVGKSQACAIRTDGALVCWGTDNTLASGAPTPPEGRHFTHVSAGLTHDCALVDDGSIQCWGNNQYGQLNVPALAAGVHYTQVSVSYNYRLDPDPQQPPLQHTCALRSDGTAVCWGSNWSGQLNVPTLPGGMTYTSVSAGLWHTCVSRSDGAVLCSGNDWEGQIDVPPTLNLLKQTQPIVFTPAVPNPAVLGKLFQPLPNAGSGNPVVFNSLTPAVCVFTSDPQPYVWFMAEGTCSFSADRAGNDVYEPSPQLIVTVTVAVGTQTITFTSVAPNPGYVGDTYTVTAHGGDSGQDVTFSSLTQATCTVAGNAVTFVAEGDCTVAADQGGSQTYNPAAQVTQSVTVTRRSQTIELISSPPNPAYVGDSYVAGATVGANGNVVAIAAEPAAVCTATGNAIAFVAVGTCTVTATQDGNASYAPASPLTQTITVVRHPQAIAFNPALPAEGLVGNSLTVAATGGGSGNPVTFTVLTAGTCGLTGSTLSLTNIGNCTVSADQAGSTAYDAAPSKTATIVVRWPFTGFVGLLAPPAVNTGVRAGDPVVLKFSLGGNRGTSIFAGSPTVAPYSCGTGATAPAPGSGSPVTGALAYQASTGQYTYTYTTLKTRLKGTCIRLSLPLADGTIRTALFQFR